MFFVSKGSVLDFYFEWDPGLVEKQLIAVKQNLNIIFYAVFIIN